MGIDKIPMSTQNILDIIDKLRSKSSPAEFEALNRIRVIVAQADKNSLYPVDMLINFLKIESETLTVLKDALKRIQIGRKPNIKK